MTTHKAERGVLGDRGDLADRGNLTDCGCLSDRGDLVILNARLVDRDVDQGGALVARDGKITAVFTGPDADSLARAFAPDLPTRDAEGAALMPAFVDLHAHFRDPGLTYKEDVVTASRAAAAGGYGTVVLMANTNPVVSDAVAARAVNARVAEVGYIDAFQAVSLTRDFGGVDTAALDALDPSVVPVATEDGKEIASAAVMLEAMERCARTGVVVSCHCEDPTLASRAKLSRDAALSVLKESGFFTKIGEPKNNAQASAQSTALAIARRHLADAGRVLRLAEDVMTERNLALARAAGCRVHIAHVSTVGALDAVRRAKALASSASAGYAGAAGDAAGNARGYAVTCEATPHHLALTDELLEIVNPPLRAEADREALIQALIDGTVDAIATDHAPHTAADKAVGSPGFSGIQAAFALCNKALVATGRISLSRLSALLSANPARVLGLNRGLLRVGFDADLVLVDPAARWTVDPEDAAWYSRGKNTPLAGRSLVGRVLATWKSGRATYPFDESISR